MGGGDMMGAAAGQVRVLVLCESMQASLDMLWHSCPLRHRPRMAHGEHHTRCHDTRRGSLHTVLSCALHLVVPSCTALL